MTIDLSVCVPTKNSGETIDECLESIYDIANEINIIDSNSNDGTLDICKSYDTNIYQHEFSGFAELKRYAISKATSEWVLILDSDEVVSKTLRESIESTLPDTEAAAFEIKLQNRMFGEWVHFSQTKTCLVRREYAVVEESYVHEKVTVTSEQRGDIDTIDGVIFHTTYKDTEEYLRKFQQYTALEALKAEKEQESISLLREIIDGIATSVYMLTINKAILDGYRGLFFSLMTFQYRIVKYSKYRDIQRLKESSPDSWEEEWKEGIQRK